MGFGDEVASCSWTICKQSAPRSRQITTPTPHHWIFYRPNALPDAQPTVSKHWRHGTLSYLRQIKISSFFHFASIYPQFNKQFIFNTRNLVKRVFVILSFRYRGHSCTGVGTNSKTTTNSRSSFLLTKNAFRTAGRRHSQAGLWMNGTVYQLL